jgi:pimeloyl-ACP methyl ester carboxylesterase
VEFHKIIEPLADPVACGGRRQDAFHVVCPSIPGFGFSSPPTKPGVGTQAVSELFMRLMSDLGYHRFFVQGGDLGSGISLRIGRLGQKRIRGMHLNMALVFEPASDPMRGVTPEEQAEIDSRNDPDDMAYGRIQSARPQSLGYGLNDSPAALAGWIVEKFHAWTDHRGDHEAAVSREEILTNICIYWFTGTITSSFRYYYENAHVDESRLSLHSQIPAPLSVALSPKDLLHPPRAWAERQFNLSRWTRMPRGGHFAALEEPGLLVEDIRAAFRPHR